MNWELVHDAQDDRYRIIDGMDGVAMIYQTGPKGKRVGQLLAAAPELRRLVEALREKLVGVYCSEFCASQRHGCTLEESIVEAEALLKELGEWDK
jgi:hypothetical protein